MVRFFHFLLSLNINSDKQLKKFAAKNKYSLIESYLPSCNGCRIMSQSIGYRAKNQSVKLGVIQSKDKQAFDKKFYFGNVPAFYIIDNNANVVGSPYIGISTPQVVKLIGDIKKLSSS